MFVCVCVFKGSCDCSEGKLYSELRLALCCDAIFPAIENRHSDGVDTAIHRMVFARYDSVALHAVCAFHHDG